ncbi:MAG: hypothetical protein J6Q89_08175 [Clostridia bacterium]|nr:hypothetical protein [Clostridia bacterium]
MDFCISIAKKFVFAIIILRGEFMFLFKNTKSRIKRIGMNMAVYGFASAFNVMILALFLPEVIANYVYVLMVVCSIAAITGSIISIIWFIYELTPYAINKQIKREINIESNSHKEDTALVLPPHCKHLCSISMDNSGVETIVGYKLKRKFELGYDSFSIFLDREEGVLFFVHDTLEHVGAAYDSRAQYISPVSFDNMQSLLLYELNHYKALVERWKNENDIQRANSCQERVKEFEKILNTKENDWKDLLNL